MSIYEYMFCINHEILSLLSRPNIKNQSHLRKESKNILNFRLKEAGVSAAFRYRAPEIIRSSFFSRIKRVLVICAYFANPKMLSKLTIVQLLSSNRFRQCSMKNVLWA